jgi:hypothetical protein
MTDLLTQFALVILGLIFLLNIRTVINNVHLGVAPTKTSWGTSPSHGHTPVETISTCPGRSRTQAARPRATFAVIAAVLPGVHRHRHERLSVHLVDGQYTTALATTYKSDPVAGIVTGQHRLDDSCFLAAPGRLSPSPSW